MSQNNSNDKAAMLAKIEGINKVDGFDPTPFAVDYTDLETGEVRKRLPVMIQMAWFRMKYPEGRIAITVSPGKDCFVATAKVYPSYKDGAECYLAEATASRGYLADKPSVSPREWAQTAAVGIALRNAGFGLQFAMAGDEFEGTATDELNGNSAQAGGSTPHENPAVTPEPETEEEYTVEPTAPPQRELTFEEKVEQAMRVPCPITKYGGKTLGDVLQMDPKAIQWCATKFTGGEEIRNAAKLICEYKTSFKTKSKAQWTPVAVRRILTNPVYVGTLVQGIRTRPNYKIKTVIVNEQDKWAIYENAHEAIINPRQFVLVQRLLELDTRTSPRENGLFPLAGLLCCGDCGGAMVRKTQTSGNKRFCYYTCSNHKNTGECTSHRISQKQLEDAVLRLLQEHIRMLAELDSCLQTIRNAPVHRLSIRKAEDRLAAVEADIDRYRKLKISAYEDMRDGILSKEDYLDIKEQYEMRISEAQLAEEQIRHEIDLYIENGNAPQRWIQEFLDHRNIQCLTRIVAVECIDHIMIYEGKRIEVTFAHMQDYEALVSRVKDYYINQREVG